MDDWERAIDAGSTIHTCFLDVAKAFDRVDHTLLEHTLLTVGVQAKELSWFVSYLSQRTAPASTAVSHHLSRSRQEFPGQGSVLGPLLFILYFRDMHIVLSPLHVLCLPTILSCMTVAMASALINRAVVW